MAEFESLARTLEEFHIGFADYVMLHLVYYERRSAIDAPHWARGLLEHTNLPLPTVTECENAIRSLCSRKFVAIVDLTVQRQIARDIETFHGIGPTGGMPFPGQLDFTLAGAELWRAVLNFEHPASCIDFFWYGVGAFIYRRNATILIGHDLDGVLNDVRLCEFIPMSPPEQIGVWRRQWWHEIPSGYLQRCLPIRE